MAGQGRGKDQVERGCRGRSGGEQEAAGAVVRSEFDRRVARRGAVATPFGATGGPAGGFWWGRRRAQGDAELTRLAADAARRESLLARRALPGQPLVGHGRLGEAELRVGKQDQDG